MNRGCAPTDRQARTGLFTPPGINLCAWEKSLFDWSFFIAAGPFL
jgi:hypothetical protein